MAEATDDTPTEARDPERAEKLLGACNSASAHVGVLHVAFMGLCAYVLVIVFGTTDMDLLIGKGVNLPVVGVDVPIVGFYAFAPYLIVLVHFNLLLQLQLLSRKLYAFDAVAPAEEGMGGLRDQLHVFPYTYYLIGQPSPVVRRLLGVVVTITILLLPLATLLILQIGFLAYQSEAVTWAQRFATWFDVVLVVALWPVIMDSKDDWWGYLRRMDQRMRSRPIRAFLWGLVWVAMMICWLTENDEVFVLASLGVILLLVVVALVPPAEKLWYRLRKRSRSRNAFVQRGVPGLIVVLGLGSVLPTVLLMDGEVAEGLVRGHDGYPLKDVLTLGPILTEIAENHRRIANYYLRFQRHLQLSEQVILAKEAKPEIIAKLRSKSDEVWNGVSDQVVPVNLQGRSLRGADLSKALLSRADLRNIQLQRSNMFEARLQGSDLRWAQLEGARMDYAFLQNADLYMADLRDAYFRDARLQGANLQSALLRGANLDVAQLHGVNLRMADLQGASLWGSQLVGANLRSVNFKGADLTRAELQAALLVQADMRGAEFSGADLRGVDLSNANIEGANFFHANLYGADFKEAKLTLLLDLRGAMWHPLSKEEEDRIEKMLPDIDDGSNRKGSLMHRLQEASRPGKNAPRLESCLRDDETSPALRCEKEWKEREIDDFRVRLHAVLLRQACADGAISKRWLEFRNLGAVVSANHPRFGLARKLLAKAGDPACVGIKTLSSEEKADLTREVGAEDELPRKGIGIRQRR